MKKIGLLMDIGQEEKIWLNYAYFQFAERICETFSEKLGRGITLIHPWSQEVDESVGLLYLPGGSDIAPLRYNEPRIPWLSGGQNANFEYFDMTLLPKYLERKVPVFGTCRGHQSINVHFGGSLFQHVDEPTSSSFRGQPVHWGIDTRDHNCFMLNSLHHQAIKKLGEGLEVILHGFAKQKKKVIDLHIEAIRHKELPIFCHQFHCEELKDDEKTGPTINWVLNEISQII